MKKALSWALFAIMLGMATVVFAHPGRTDGSGGHYNHKDGSYHYHNGGRK